MTNSVSDANGEKPAAELDLEDGSQQKCEVISHESPPHDQEEEQEVVLNPIARVFKESDLGKMIFGLILPLAGAFLTPLAPKHHVLRILILSCTCFGFAGLWNGILLRNIMPRYANALEQTGAGLVVFAFYTLISSLLPDYFKWIPWISFVVVLLPYYLQLANLGFT